LLSVQELQGRRLFQQSFNDVESILIVHRNLTGQNPVSPGYVEMMEKQLELTIDASKLWIDKRMSVPNSRVQRGDVATLHSLSGRYVYELDSDRPQFFCETPAAWELWDETGQLHRVQRWPKKRISWVILKDESTPVRAKTDTHPQEK